MNYQLRPGMTYLQPSAIRVQQLLNVNPDPPRGIHLRPPPSIIHRTVQFNSATQLSLRVSNA